MRESSTDVHGNMASSELVASIHGAPDTYKRRTEAEWEVFKDQVSGLQVKVVDPGQRTLRVCANGRKDPS